MTYDEKMADHQNYLNRLRNDPDDPLSEAVYGYAKTLWERINDEVSRDIPIPGCSSLDGTEFCMTWYLEDEALHVEIDEFKLQPIGWYYRKHSTKTDWYFESCPGDPFDSRLVEFLLRVATNKITI